MHLVTLKPGAGSQKSCKRVGRGIGSGLGKLVGVAIRVKSQDPGVSVVWIRGWPTASANAPT